MKKLLILMLVLGVASVANATLLISVNGVVDPPETEVTLLHGETAIIDVMGDGRPQPAGAYLIPDALGSVSGGVMLYPGTLSFLGNYAQGDGSGVIPWLQGAGYPGATTAVYMSFAHPVPLALTGRLVDEIVFRCEGIGDSVLTLVDQALTPIEDIQIIHQIIPEPMTVMLLGLGGLFLRRRK